ncbi:riboflavin kinase FMN adenylyltransferase [Ligilactobacillus equi DSM 15833 = JCM 10991]|uniref:Riboflavin biosynthesis protein n=1 Tax=Ligilactobacillus equi DSM 15833 = JCM 10991 TaxID=1423740 RepID=A0A0R1TE56_9LACO|nr:riboflavin kinase FMN adenylyltransferase [Ligilactobacillus equi DSM 15833 = JCM 10991]
MEKRVQVYELSGPPGPNEIIADQLVLALGFFDGVHRGHQRVIAKAKEVAHKIGAQVGVLTFDRLPRSAFEDLGPIHYLTNRRQKIQRFENLGLDVVYIAEFNEAMQTLTPQAFVDQYLVGLKVVAVVAGEDYTYGPKQLANMTNLPQFAHGRFAIYQVAHLDENASRKISSTTIRQDLDQGKVEDANRLLGYIYRTYGPVVHGFARGRTLGYPTLNVQTSMDQRLPQEGVYAVKVKIDGKLYNGMASVGHNDTFGDDLALTVEVNVFDFAQDVYGQEVTIYWYSQTRGMIKFNGIDELQNQLDTDRQEIKAYFARLDEKMS